MSWAKSKEFEAAQLREPPFDTTSGDQPTQQIGENNDLLRGPNELHTSDPEHPASNPFVEAAKRIVTIPEAMGEMRVRRARYARTTVRQYLESLTPPLAEQYCKLHDAHSYYDQVCAGAKHHHWWLGGMSDHVKEMIGLCLDLYDLYPGDLKNLVTRDDIIVACYLHDFAKVWMYEFIDEEDRERNPKKYLEQQLFKPVYGAFNIVDEESKTLLTLSKFGIVPTEKQWSAVLFAEGGYADRNFGINGLTHVADTVMAQNPLAVLIHMADLYSSQVLGRSIA
jgi:hypothetical protein